ncbi:hypothetical protein LWI29_031498 [Acer saccharum]|uniref:CCHC-type domain-containing protein n=1 Tax=Acer saccharum TaxID=4024 RepID=A0AA39SQN5_ACESA|nr:hypothetical protein LWI29_031498 [Acer saccharum]
MGAKFKFKKFNESNFTLWKMKIRVILMKDNCLAAISERPTEITDDDEWNKIDGNAVANLHLALADGVLSSVAEKKMAKEIWDTLTKLYEAKSLHHKIFLKRRLYTVRMVESLSITNHCNTLNTLFSPLIVLDYLLFNDITSVVLEEESRRKNREDKLANSQQAEALSMTRERLMERGPSGSHNHGRSKSRSKKNIKCYYCGKKRHVKSECWLNKKSGGNKAPKSSNSQGCVASTSDDGEVLYNEATTVVEGRKQFADV